MLFAQAALNLLADAATVDPFAGLYQNWPWMLVVVALGRWIGSMLEKVATRHICFIDACDTRDLASLSHQATTSAALTAISEKMTESRAKLSTIETKVENRQCGWTPPAQLSHAT